LPFYYFPDELKDLFSFDDNVSLDSCNTHDLIGCDCDSDGRNVEKCDDDDSDNGQSQSSFFFFNMNARAKEGLCREPLIKGRAEHS